MTALEDAHLHFAAGGLRTLNVALAFLMFSVSLFIERAQVATLRRNPRGFFAGLASQWLWMPLLTVGVVLALRPAPGVALGLLLVAACPGGNVSNFLSMAAHANVALAISLVAVSTVAATLATPALFTLTAHLALPGETLPALQVDFTGMLLSVLSIVGAPLLLGTLLKWRAPDFALRIRNPVRRMAGLLLLILIGVGLSDNFQLFLDTLPHVFGWVALLNALALAGGYAIGALLRLPEADRRALSIETGIHNSGLGLVLVFNFFDGSGPMALIAAWWGVWHLVSGSALAAIWSRFPPAAPRA